MKKGDVHQEQLRLADRGMDNLPVRFSEGT